MLRFLEDFNQAIHEGCQPQEPLEEGGDHDGADDGRVSNLWGIPVSICTPSKHVTHVSSYGKFNRSYSHLSPAMSCRIEPSWAKYV